MQILVVQLNPTIGAFAQNLNKILSFIERGKKEGAELIVFPEMALCGYPPEDLVLHDAFVKEAEKTLQEIIPHTQGIMVVVGLVRRNLSSGEKPLFDTAAILQDGKLVGFYDKQLLPTYDVFDERRYFEMGKQTPVWTWKGKKIGVLICEDIWQHAGYVGFTHYARDPVVEMASLKPDLVINLSASPYQFNKLETRLKVCEKATRTLRCPLILCCQVGGSDQLIFDGYSLCVSAQGQLVERGKGFEEEAFTFQVEETSSPIPFSTDSLGDLYQALVLGTRDYFHKQGFKKGVMGLSGGIDSALVACIATDALGKENMLGVGMPSRYSSLGSVQDAKALAHNLGMSFELIPLESVFDAYLKLLIPHFQGKSIDVTEENLQARIRGALLMALSNKHGSLVLNTGNKSELALGYCTLYGDMIGALGVLGDVTKTQVYELARWVNREEEVIPLSTLEKVPSAELRPNQKDSDTLPPYAVIDTIIQAYIEDFLSVEEIVKKHTFSLELVKDIVHKIHLAEYKRRQAPPGLKVSKKAFRVGRRYPIVQGWA